MKIYHILNDKIDEFDVITETEKSYFVRSEKNKTFPDIYYEMMFDKHSVNRSIFLTKAEAIKNLQEKKRQEIEELQKELTEA